MALLVLLLQVYSPGAGSGGWGVGGLGAKEWGMPPTTGPEESVRD